MKNIYIFVLLCLSTNIVGQEITYKITSPLTIYADSINHIYSFYSYLSNHSFDTIAIKYVRVKKDITPNNIFNGLCTDINCYYVNQDTILEYIPPMTAHKIESRWQVIMGEIDEGRGYSEWELSFNDTKDVIGTFPNEFVFKQTPTATTELDFETLSINPNPVENILRFSEEGLTDIRIYGLSGQKKLSHQFLDGREIDVSHLSSGLYIGLAIKGNQRFRFKFLKS